ncbi:hypothetical protein G3M53_07740 [Streptomyces sp. SID7982]|uniref:hypothetical protein n=1 Tax=Streptomyces sp. DT197 TaxID=3393417 RepID=UPI0013BF0E98|nr:hypothetical protein [Streptomyces sp. SID7982]
MNGDRRTNLAAAATSGIDMLIKAAGGAIGAIAGFALPPETWSGDTRVAIAGIAAITVGSAFNDLSETALTSLRRRLGLPTGRPTDAAAAPSSLPESVDLAATAVKDDAAVRAASAAWHIDHSRGFLDLASRWQGYEDGTATNYLAPGVLLHYRTEKRGRLEMPQFSLLTGDDRERPVEHVKEIHSYLLTRAARDADASSDAPTTA